MRQKHLETLTHRGKITYLHFSSNCVKSIKQSKKHPMDHPLFDAMLKRHALETELLSSSLKASIPKGFMGKKPSAQAVATAEAKAAEKRAALVSTHEREVASFLASPPEIVAAPLVLPASAVGAREETAAAAAAAAEVVEEEEDEEEAEGTACGGGGMKLSRKERRRLKQAQLEAEQAKLDAQYLAARAGSSGGGGGGGSSATAKEVEMQALLGQLSPLGLGITPIAADGNCLYRAVADQLQQQMQRGAGLPVSAALAEHRALRARAAEFIRTYWEDFAPFLHYEAADGYAEAERTGDLRSAVVRYSERMAASSAWGGHPELRALANVLGCRVIVFRAGAQPLQFDPKGEETAVSGKGGARQLRITFHAHQLSAGEHYNSVKELRERL